MSGSGRGVRRRDFMTLLGGTAAWPLAAHAQQGQGMRRIGMLMAYAERDWEGQLFVATFVEGLAKLGWVEGRSIRIDAGYRPATTPTQD
jgi:putative ABC transport system substrate-binding protein